MTSYQTYNCLSILPGSSVLPGIILSQPNADLVRQLFLSQLEGCWSTHLPAPGKYCAHLFLLACHCLHSPSRPTCNGRGMRDTPCACPSPGKSRLHHQAAAWKEVLKKHLALQVAGVYPPGALRTYQKEREKKYSLVRCTAKGL